ncbi:unnamed protein product [Cylicocyclus nassatus]|uniref:SCP domain-containing protein n=1 Tax=Cylicocyclus nassatus TaxID=53992 RepID=A0AA36GNT3_CYLNA|nr:unnamed protein product [Cylicocyclus nassatus]
MELLLVVATHLLLLFSSITYTNAENIECTGFGLPSSSPSKADRGKMLDVFNKVRENIVNEKDLEKQYLKKAKNMYKLFWDCGMEKQLTDAINPAKAKLTLTTNYAQNYAIFAKSLLASKNPEGYSMMAETEWFNQVAYVGGLDKNQTYKGGLDFFANMVNAKATKVACAYKEDATNTYIHYSCIFNVKPVKGQSIYERGTPCTKDSKCTTYPGSTCNATTKLCEYLGIVVPA